MSNGLNGQSVTVVLYSAAAMLAVLGVAVMTLEWRDQQTASNENPPGTVLAKAGPPVDLALGQPVQSATLQRDR